MKNLELELEQYEVQDLNQSEMEEIDGGYFFMYILRQNKMYAQNLGTGTEMS